MAANGGRGGYRAWRAHLDAGLRATRPKAPKLAQGPLAAQVTEWMEEWWSPVEIAHRLRLKFPDAPMMRVSHETIYQSKFGQGGGKLRRELSVPAERSSPNHETCDRRSSRGARDRLSGYGTGNPLAAPPLNLRSPTVVAYACRQDPEPARRGLAQRGFV